MTNETAPAESEQNESLPVSTPTSNSGKVVIRSLAAAVAGCVGAILSWKVIELIGDVFVLPADLAGLAFGQVPPPEIQAKVVAATYAVNIKNAALWMGAVGAILGTVFGLTICLSRRLRLSCIRMMFATQLLGTLFGALAGVASVWINTVSRQHMAAGATSPAEQFILLMHSATWLIVGLGIGLGIAVGGRRMGLSRIESTVVIGLVGMVGGCLFPIVAGLLFPAVSSNGPIPPLDPTAGRILWLSLPSALMGLAIGRNG